MKPCLVEMNTKPIGVAVAGLGFGEAVHLAALAASPHLQPVALWHPRRERLDEASAVHGLTGYVEWDALLADPHVDAVIIATPPAPRFELARQALEAGKHLLLEKPVALNAELVRELQRLAIAGGLSVGVDFEYRAVPLFMQAARMLASGAIGTPWLVKLDWLMSSRADSGRAWNWYSDASQGGGVIGALGTHAFDMLAWLFGPLVDVKGLNNISISERPHPQKGFAPVDAEDVSLVQCKLQWLGQAEQLLPAQITLSSVARNGRGCWLEIYGSEGSLVLGSENQKDYVHGFGLWHAGIGELPRSIAVDPDLAFATTWTDGRVAPVARIQEWWAESILSGRPMVPGLLEGEASQKACDQALRA